LKPYAEFNHSENSFYLKQNPFPAEHIHPGPYRIGKHIENANVYRVGHPLAQKVITECKDKDIDVTELTFDYSNAGKLISIIESLKGKSGWLTVSQLTISSFEMEDHLLFAGFTSDGEILNAEQCQRIFSLPAEFADTVLEVPAEINDRFATIKHQQEIGINEDNAERNSHYFDDEVEKLDKWAEDVRNSLNTELKELAKEIKARKTEARKLLNLEQKVKEQRTIKELEKKLADKRVNLYHAEDDVDKRKETMLDEMEARLKQNAQHTNILTIRWTLI
jgi:hypothetical protein